MEAFQQRLTDSSYLRQEEVTFGECDRNERLRMAGLLGKLACFAGYDYDARGMTREKMMERGCVFLLSRVAVRLHRRPRYGEVLSIETWEAGTRGAHMQRDYALRDRTGAVCAACRSDWLIADPVRHKILRPHSLVRDEFPAAPVELDCPLPKKLLPIREDLEELGVRRVCWSDLDGNGHLFSGRYGDIIWDFLPEDLREREVREFYLNYNKEAALGQELRLLGHREENAYRMEGLGPDSTCFTALCVY